MTQYYPSFPKVTKDQAAEEKDHADRNWKVHAQLTYRDVSR
jgi:hypothetical protein